MTTPSHERAMRPTIAVWQPTIAWTDGGAGVNSVVWAPEGQFAETLTKQIESYKHVLRALGGYWEARFRINAGREQIERWLEERLGWHIEVYDEAQQTIFEGFVNRIDAVIGGFAVARGPLACQSANKASVVYSTVDTTTTPPTFGLRATTAITEDDPQQRQYGIIERVLSAGGCAAVEADQVRDTWLSENARPRTTKRWSNIPSGRTSLTVTVFGYVRLMNCYIYEHLTSGTELLTVKLERVLDQDPNNLLASANSSIVSAFSVTVKQYDVQMRTAWAVVKDLVARGDTNDDRYIFGVWANRRAVYAIAPDVVEYHVRMSDVAQRIETLIGVQVFPWAVLPGKWALVTDFLVARAPPIADPREDPRALFIEQVTYTMPWTFALQCGRVDRTDQMLAEMGLSGLGG